MKQGRAQEQSRWGRRKANLSSKAISPAPDSMIGNAQRSRHNDEANDLRPRVEGPDGRAKPAFRWLTRRRKEMNQDELNRSRHTCSTSWRALPTNHPRLRRDRSILSAPVDRDPGGVPKGKKKPKRPSRSRQAHGREDRPRTTPRQTDGIAEAGRSWKVKDLLDPARRRNIALSNGGSNG